jgi:hypothetical protein
MQPIRRFSCNATTGKWVRDHVALISEHPDEEVGKLNGEASRMGLETSLCTVADVR